MILLSTDKCSSAAPQIGVRRCCVLSALREKRFFASDREQKPSAFQASGKRALKGPGYCTCNPKGGPFALGGNNRQLQCLLPDPAAALRRVSGAKGPRPGNSGRGPFHVCSFHRPPPVLPVIRAAPLPGIRLDRPPWHYFSGSVCLCAPSAERIPRDLTSMAPRLKCAHRSYRPMFCAAFGSICPDPAHS